MTEAAVSSTDVGPIEDREATSAVAGSKLPAVLSTAAVVALVAAVLRLFVVQSYLIPSSSMSPTLVDGDRVIVNQLSYAFGDVERGQVVVFDRPALLEGEDDVIKRVVGLPGETVRLFNKQVYVNEEYQVVEPYVAEPDSTRRSRKIPGCAQDVASADICVVPAGHVFVLGDNRVGSEDSRDFGPIAIESIVGRAFVVGWPLDHIGRI